MNSSFSFNGELFEQIDGVAKGGSLSCLMVDVLMNHLVDKALSKKSCCPSSLR